MAVSGQRVAAHCPVLKNCPLRSVQEPLASVTVQLPDREAPRLRAACRLPTLQQAISPIQQTYAMARRGSRAAFRESASTLHGSPMGRNHQFEFFHSLPVRNGAHCSRTRGYPPSPPRRQKARWIGATDQGHRSRGRHQRAGGQCRIKAFFKILPISTVPSNLLRQPPVRWAISCFHALLQPPPGTTAQRPTPQWQRRTPWKSAWRHQRMGICTSFRGLRPKPQPKEHAGHDAHCQRGQP